MQLHASLPRATLHLGCATLPSPRALAQQRRLRRRRAATLHHPALLPVLCVVLVLWLRIVKHCAAFLHKSSLPRCRWSRCS